jgi:hypothetical protein
LSKTEMPTPKRHFRFAPINGHHQASPVGPFRATFGLTHRMKLPALFAGWA